MEGIQVSTEVSGSQNQVSIIKVGGFIDTTTSSEVERALNSLLKQNRFNIIIDLGNVDYISSAGWGIFISEIKSIRENNGDLKLVRMIPDVYEIFELLEFHHILDVYDSVEEAVQKYDEMIVQGTEELARESVGIRTSSAGSAVKESSFTPPKPKIEAAPMQTTPITSETTLGEGKTAAIPIAEESLETKIKYIVAQNPYLGAYKINKILNTEKYGFTKIGWFGVRSTLSQLGLSSQKSRKRFAHEHTESNR